MQDVVRDVPLSHILGCKAVPPEVAVGVGREHGAQTSMAPAAYFSPSGPKGSPPPRGKTELLSVARKSGVPY